MAAVDRPRSVLVVPNVSLPRELTGFTYSVPSSLESGLSVGSIVEVPFRNRTVRGVVWVLDPPPNPRSTRPITRVTPDRVPPGAMAFAGELAREHLASPAAFIRSVMGKAVHAFRNEPGGQYLAYLGRPTEDRTVLDTLAGTRPTLVLAAGPGAETLPKASGRWVRGADAAVLAVEDPRALIVYREELPEHRRRVPPFLDLRRAAAVRSRSFGVPVTLTARCLRVETAQALDRTELREVTPIPELPPGTVQVSSEGFRDASVLETLRACIAAGGSAFVWVPAGGFAGALACTSCGFTVRCRRCGVANRVRPDGSAVCGSCAEPSDPPLVCPRCGSALTSRALGVAGVRAQLRRLAADLPFATLAATDPVPSPAFRGILVGTHAHLAALPRWQTAAAVVYGLERFLAVPDFRAEERFAQRLTDLRFALSDGAPLVLLARDTDVARTWCSDPRNRIPALLPDRDRFRYPPFVRLVLVSGASAPSIAERFRNLSGVERVDALPGSVPRSLLRVTPDAWADVAPHLIALPRTVMVEPDPDGFGV